MRDAIQSIIQINPRTRTGTAPLRSEMCQTKMIWPCWVVTPLENTPEISCIPVPSFSVIIMFAKTFAGRQERPIVSFGRKIGGIGGSGTRSLRALNHFELLSLTPQA